MGQCLIGRSSSISKELNYASGKTMFASGSELTGTFENDGVIIYMKVYAGSTSTAKGRIFIDGFEILSAYTNEAVTREFSGCLPIKKGSSYRLVGGNGALLTYIPCK